MLYDFLVQTCGIEWANPAPVILGPRRDFPAMTDDANLYDDAILNSLLMMNTTQRVASMLDVTGFD